MRERGAGAGGLRTARTRDAQTEAWIYDGTSAGDYKSPLQFWLLSRLRAGCARCFCAVALGVAAGGLRALPLILPGG